MKIALIAMKNLQKIKAMKNRIKPVKDLFPTNSYMIIWLNSVLSNNT